MGLTEAPGHPSAVDIVTRAVRVHCSSCHRPQLVQGDIAGETPHVDIITCRRCKARSRVTTFVEPLDVPQKAGREPA